jgi:hypothetical protein
MLLHHCLQLRLQDSGNKSSTVTTWRVIQVLLMHSENTSCCTTACSCACRAAETQAALLRPCKL